jgi:DNA-binding NarL/FixJ family response regulator
VHRSGKHQAPPVGRPNTLGLRGHELADILDDFDVTDPLGVSQRDFVRWPFRSTSLAVTLVHPGGNSANIHMACRNISRGGISLLHSTYLHPGSRCTVQLPHVFQGLVSIDGRIVRCSHRSGMVHEIGLAFSRPIDVHDFVPALRTDIFTLERVDPALLAGTVLYIEDCANSVKIFEHHLRESSLDITVRRSSDPEPRSSFDAIVAGHPVGDADQSQCLSRTRSRLPQAALIVLTSQHPESARRSMAALNPDTVLVRPVQQDQLLRALGEYLIVRRSMRELAAGPETQSGSVPAPSAWAVMAHCARRLKDTVNSRDIAACRALCIQIAGVSPGLGLRGVGRIAMQAADELTRTQDLQQASRTLNAVIAACERVQASAA